MRGLSGAGLADQNDCLILFDGFDDLALHREHRQFLSLKVQFGYLRFSLAVERGTGERTLEFVHFAVLGSHKIRVRRPNVLGRSLRSGHISKLTFFSVVYFCLNRRFEQKQIRRCHGNGKLRSNEKNFPSKMVKIVAKKLSKFASLLWRSVMRLKSNLASNYNFATFKLAKTFPSSPLPVVFFVSSRKLSL